MAASRIYLHYEPKLYSDLIQQLFEDIGQDVIVSEGEVKDAVQVSEQGKQGGGAIVLLSLENQDLPPDERLADLMPNAKILAFSPNGKFCYRRLPGETGWEEICPFGLAELLYEVLSDGNRDQIRNFSE